MSKPIILTYNAWNKIFALIRHDYTPSVSLISWKRKEVLGFTVREYRESYPPQDPLMASCTIRLDFYDDAKMTFFMLKYGDHVDFGKSDGMVS